MMNLDDMIAARRERDEELQAESGRRMDATFVGLAEIIADSDRALAHPGDDAGLRDSFAAVRERLERLLAENGVVLIGKPGEIVDPQQHCVVEASGKPVQALPRIVEVIAYGARSTRDGRLLAAARVVATVQADRSEG